MTVHVVVPNDIDDPARPSGGNVYDRRLMGTLMERGWEVREHAVGGDWPDADPAARTDLAATLAALPGGALVVVDGLIASAVPDVIVPAASRLRLVVLVHLPLGDAGGPVERAREAAALSAAAAVVTTSRWCRARVLDLYDLPPDGVHVAVPGVDPAPLTVGTPAGTRLLCVAAVTRHKGHDVLVQALSDVADRPWDCVCVGSVDRERAFVDGLRSRARAGGIAERVSFVGSRRWSDMSTWYAEADLLVLPSRGETYGMVVTEALARGLPVVATTAKGLPEALGRAVDGELPGILVPPDDAPALSDALRGWLDDPALRHELRERARERRKTLTTWTDTASAFAHAASGVSRNITVHS